MLPALPFIAVGVAAAAVGWAGATVWKRLQEQREGAAETTPGGQSGARPGKAAGEARALVWCPACRTWFVADGGRGCEAPDCPYPAGRAAG